MDFIERVFIVTGGSHGVGRACVSWLVQRGAKVFTCGRSLKDLQVLQEIYGENVRFVAGNLAESNFAINLPRLAINAFGRVDGVIANAGNSAVASALEATESSIRDFFELRLLSVWLLVQAATPALRQQKGSSVVVVAGAAGVDPTPFLAVPSVINAGLISLARAFSDELAEFGIRVNTVNPGTLETRLGAEVLDRYSEVSGLDRDLLESEVRLGNPLGRIPTPDDIASAIGFLLSPEASMITGNVVTPDGGVLSRRFRY